MAPNLLALMHMLRTSRAVQAYLVIYVLAFAYLAWRGRWDSLVQQAMWLSAVALILLAAWLSTAGREAESLPPVQGPARRRVKWQLVVHALLISGRPTRKGAPAGSLSAWGRGIGYASAFSISSTRPSNTVKACSTGFGVAMSTPAPLSSSMG